jgi:hypothetical protein
LVFNELKWLHRNYRLMHPFFDIKTVIILRDRYQPEGFSPRVDIRRRMITILIWKKACINLFITYFNIELRGLISCYQSFASISAHGLLSQWHFRCLRMGKIDVITYKYVIIYCIECLIMLQWHDNNNIYNNNNTLFYEGKLS